MNAGMVKLSIDKGILFLCVANSARSQMAEGLARKMFGEGISIQSAGSQPAVLNTMAVDVMGEIGIDISGQRAKSIRDVDIFKVGMVVNLCVDEICPQFAIPFSRLYWFLPNPAMSMPGQDVITRYRATRDELKKRIEALHAEYCFASLPVLKPATTAVEFSMNPFRKPVTPSQRHAVVGV